jgi:hypothetical protein
MSCVQTLPDISMAAQDPASRGHRPESQNLGHNSVGPFCGDPVLAGAEWSVAWTEVYLLRALGRTPDPRSGRKASDDSRSLASRRRPAF